MTYKGRYFPTNPKKYRGNPNQIIYRSLWERKLMVYCDKNERILEWGSEEIVIPYISPLDNKKHRYFPDFIVKVRENNGNHRTKVIEVKPYKQTIPPEKGKKRKKTYLSECTTYIVNEAKWEAAKEFCRKRDWSFVILTEKELF